MQDTPLQSLHIYNRKDHRRLFGLIGLSGTCDDSLQKDTASVRISVGGYDRRLPLASLLDHRSDGETGRIMFGILTQLLPNGPAELKIEQLVNGADNGAGRMLYRQELLIDNHGPLAEEVREALADAGVNPIFGSSISSEQFPYSDRRGAAWFDRGESPAVPLSVEPQASEATAIDHLRAYGFALLPFVLPEQMCDDLNDAFDREVAEGRINYKWGSSERVQQLHRLPAGQSIWRYEPIVSFLRKWFRDEPVACQSLYFAFGSEQHAHQDSIHLTPYPAGYMCGVWIALQDVEPGSGELFVYPGSHRTPHLRTADLGLPKVDKDYSPYAKFNAAIDRLIMDGGFERQTYLPKKGQILIWHENLVHGGSPRTNPERSRRSVVFHYFARGAVGYYDSRGEAAGMEDLEDA